MFKILTLKEEKLLTTPDREKYYIELRKYALNRKLTNTTPGALTIAPKLKKVTDWLAGKVTNMLSGGNVKRIASGEENIPEGAAIFAHTHQGILDNFVWIPVIPKHCIILHSAVVKKIMVLIQLNTGLILVSKKKEDAQNRINAKLDMIKILLKGHSIAYFPESAWNLSPNKLHLPMSYGFLDIARKAEVPVVPVVSEFTYDASTEKERITNIHICFGKPLYVGVNDDLSKKYEEYTEAISTMRWNLIEEKGLFHREEISVWEYINYLKGNIRNLERGGIDLNAERAHLWSAEDDFWLFHHINDISFNSKGELLGTEEEERIKQIIESRIDIRNVY